MNKRTDLKAWWPISAFLVATACVAASGGVQASDPSPPDGANICDLSVVLTWTPGDGADQHDVYFGTDHDAVASADVMNPMGVYRGRQIATGYMVSEPLEWHRVYHWRIDEVVWTGLTTVIHKGDVWTFYVWRRPIYVDDSAVDGANDGTSWTDAYLYLQDALAEAGSCDEIRVAEGTYRPDMGGGQTLDDREASFVMMSGVELYGGYSGDPNDPQDRDPDTYPSILTGDIGALGDDMDNCYHVVIGSSGARLDGFRIVRGRADQPAVPPQETSPGMYGGGMRSVNCADLVVHDCTFSANYAQQYGGGIDSFGSSLTVTDCTFSENTADVFGGGLSTRPLVLGAVTVADCTFIQNSTDGDGGGLYISNCDPATVTNCTFIENSTDGDGGGLYMSYCDPATVANCRFTINDAGSDGGGLYISNCDPVTVTGRTFTENEAGGDGAGLCIRDCSAGTVSDCRFRRNEASRDGGGMKSYNSTVTATSCTFSGNIADSYGGGVDNGLGSTIELTNCVFEKNLSDILCGAGLNNVGVATVTNCTFSENDRWGICSDSSGTTPPQLTLTNSILWGHSYRDVFAMPWERFVSRCCLEVYRDDYVNCIFWADPIFVNGLRLSGGSPCIDAGDNGAVPAGITTDLDGNERFVDHPCRADTGAGTPPIVDMGAYEYSLDDDDGDGIDNPVDTEPLTYSNEFLDADGTSGTIEERGDQFVTVTDEPSPEGVRICATELEPWHPRPALIIPCGDPALACYLGDGDMVILTCSHADITVITGTIEITFTAPDGRVATIGLGAGNSLVFDSDTFSITASPDNTGIVVVEVDGRQYDIDPGQTKMFATVDIDPDTLSLKSQGKWITCYIELSEPLDVREIDVTTVRLNEEVPAETHPTAVGDHDHDGVPDLTVKFDAGAVAEIVDVGDEVPITVTGELMNDGTVDETVFESHDTIRVTNPGGGKENK